MWFAGCHADVGGGYPEHESRLSDIALDWMVDFATGGLPVDGRIDVDLRYLSLHPSCKGMMHDELMAGGKIPWEKSVRPVAPEGTLHPSVLERLASPSVLNFTSYGPCRPANLMDHPQEPLRNGYAVAGGPTTLGGTAIGAVAQNFSLAAAGNIDGQATRIQTMTYVFSLQELKRWRERTDISAACTISDTSDLRGRLGLREWVADALDATRRDGGEELLYAGFHPKPSGGSTEKGASTRSALAKGGSRQPSSILSCDAGNMVVKKAALGEQLQQVRRDTEGALREIGSLSRTINELKDRSTSLLKTQEANVTAVSDFDAKARPYRRVLEPNIAASQARAGAVAKAAAANAKTTATAINAVEATQGQTQLAVDAFPVEIKKAETAVGAIDVDGEPCAVSEAVKDAGGLVDGVEATVASLTLSAHNVRIARSDVAMLEGQEAALGKFVKGVRPIDPPIASIGQWVIFVLSIGAGASPTWTFVRFKGPNNPLVSVSSTRTHILNISMGPTTEGSLRDPGAFVTASQTNLLLTTLLPLQGAR